MLTYDDIVIKCHVVFKRFFAFLKVVKLLSMCDKLQMKQYKITIQKEKYDGGNLTLAPLSTIARPKTVGGNRVN